MAILGKIRERSLFLIIVIALALFSFVIGDVFTRGGFGENQNSVGEINDENITREEFVNLVQLQSRRAGNRNSQIQSVNAAWDNLVREKIYKGQLEKSGIVLGEKDVLDEIIKQPFAQNNPLFKNEAGLFDKEKFTEYIATIRDSQDENQQSMDQWLDWVKYEQDIKSNLEIRTYTNLITAGMGNTLKEAENYYVENNTSLDLEYVYSPYSSVMDSLVEITDDEIVTYIKSHPKDFETEATRDVSFVKFDIKATPEDEAAIKQQLATLINDREEFNKVSKATMNVTGLLNTDNVENFFLENSSDNPLDLNFYPKSKLSKEVADSIFNLKVGQVYGPYKEGEFFKLSKLVDTKQLPDSVKSRHILLPYVGALRADASITRTEEEAKQTADSLLTILKRDKSKFEDFVTSFSSDRGSINNGGKYDWYPYAQMVPEFRDFTFENKVGDMDVVKSAFGYHIIEVEGQKQPKKVVKVATFTRKIEPSEETENDIYQKAETFTSELSDSKDMLAVIKEKKLTIQPVIGLKAMDERVSALGNQRPIVTWAFEKDTEENDIKRFDIENAYAVVILSKKNKKGLSSLYTSRLRVRPILNKQKKVEILRSRINGTDLSEIAKANNTIVNSSMAVTTSTPVLPGVGRDVDLIKALVYANKGQVLTGIEGVNGIFSVKIKDKRVPEKKNNYNPSKEILGVKNDKRIATIYDVLKSKAEIKDNRAIFY